LICPYFSNSNSNNNKKKKNWLKSLQINIRWWNREWLQSRFFSRAGQKLQVTNSTFVSSSLYPEDRRRREGKKERKLDGN
jgi:hypothetical protein